MAVGTGGEDARGTVAGSGRVDEGRDVEDECCCCLGMFLALGLRLVWYLVS